MINIKSYNNIIYIHLSLSLHVFTYFLGTIPTTFYRYEDIGCYLAYYVEI